MQSVGFKEWAACDLVLVSGRGKELYGSSHQTGAARRAHPQTSAPVNTNHETHYPFLNRIGISHCSREADPGTESRRGDPNQRTSQELLPRYAQESSNRRYRRDRGRYDHLRSEKLQTSLSRPSADQQEVRALPDLGVPHLLRQTASCGLHLLCASPPQLRPERRLVLSALAISNYPIASTRNGVSAGGEVSPLRLNCMS